MLLTNKDFIKSSKKKNIICINCGKEGHIYRNCTYPVVSYGIICINFKKINLNQLLTFNNKINNNIFITHEIKYYKNILDKLNKKFIKKNLKFLLINRKHTISAIEFIRGKYKTNDLNYLINTFRLMSNIEKQKILTKSFDSIWNEIWNIKKKNKAYYNEYVNSEKKFNNLKKGYIFNSSKIPIFINLEMLVKLSGNKYTETEWGFPKGRKNDNESNIDCACREFNEETDFKKSDINILDISPCSEMYLGINKIKYKHIYYLAQNIKFKKPEINKDNKNQNIEIGNIGWFNYDELLLKIRDYNHEKINMFKNLYLSLELLLLELKTKINKIIKEKKISI